jgi:hypothetical protein
MARNLLMALLFVLAGLFTMCGGLFNWDWFMLSRRARLIVRIFGRGGARIVYAALGVAISVLGLVTFVAALVVQ